MNELMRIGVDLAKNVFQVHGVDRQERAAWCRRLQRDRWLQAVTEAAPPGCEIGMKAGGLDGLSVRENHRFREGTFQPARYRSPFSVLGSESDRVFLDPVVGRERPHVLQVLDVLFDALRRVGRPANGRAAAERDTFESNDRVRPKAALQ